MKLKNKFFEKIADLTEIIEMGLLTKQEAFIKMKAIRWELCEAFGEGSDEFMECIESLIDAHSIAELL